MEKKHVFIAIVSALFLVGLLTTLKIIYNPTTNVLGARNWNKRKWTPTMTPRLTTIPTVIASITATVTAKITASPTVKPTVTIRPTSTATPRPTATPTIKPSNTPTLVPTGGGTSAGMKWGYYTGWTTTQVKDLEARVGKVGNYLATFVHWGNENALPLDLGNLAKSRGQTLVIFWEAMDYNFNGVNDTRFNYDAILRGDWNAYLTSFANQARNFGGQVILIPFEEMNGNWYPWGGTVNGNTPAKHIAAYRYVRGYFNDVANVKFAWTINSDSDPNVPGNQFTDYYPGDAYVDIVGTNGFNFGSPWMSFAQVFASGLSKLETMNKPIMIFSTASAEGSEKGNWIRTGLGQEVYKHPKVQGWIWFNENKEKNWLIWSSTDSLDAFKSVVQ